MILLVTHLLFTCLFPSWFTTVSHQWLWLLSGRC